MYAIRAVNAQTLQASTFEYATMGEQISARRTLYNTGLYSCLQTSDNEDGEWLIDKTYHYSDAQLKSVRDNNKRIDNEKKVVKKIVESAIRLGYMVTLYDGEEFTVKRSTDKKAILAAIYTTDMDKLMFRWKATGEQIGSVTLVYGNSGSEVMADWTDSPSVNLILADAIAFCDKLSAKGE